MRIRFDMMGAAFKEKAGDTQQLFKHLNQVWKDFDPKAPIYMTQAQVKDMESRRDTKALVKDIRSFEQARAAPAEIRRLRNKLASLRKRLEELAILALREAYFKNKAFERQLGNQEFHEEDDYLYTGGRDHTHLDIDRLMRAWATGTVFDADAEARTIAAMEWLRHYVSGNVKEITRPGEDRPASITTPLLKEGLLSGPAGTGTNRATASASSDNGTAGGSPPTRKTAECLICGKSYGRRAELTRHAIVHTKLLSQEFSCPVCGTVTSSPSHWSNHVEQTHGKQYAPKFVTTTNLAGETPSKPDLARQAPCAVCGRNVLVNSLLQHFNAHHAEDPTTRDRQLDCADCPDAHTLSIDSWFAHLASHHGFCQTQRCPFCTCFFQDRSLPQHVRRRHLSGTSGPLSCPTCLRKDGTTVVVEDYASWRVHCLAAGHLGESQESTSAPQGVAGVKRRREESPDGSSSPKRQRWQTLGEQSLSLSMPRIDTNFAPLDSSRRSEGERSPISSQISTSSATSAADSRSAVIDPALWQNWASQFCSPCISEIPSISTSESASQQDTSESESSQRSLRGSTVCASPVDRLNRGTGLDNPSSWAHSDVIMLHTPTAVDGEVSLAKLGSSHDESDCRSVDVEEIELAPGEDVYEIEGILKKRYNKRKRRVEFLVRWKGYSPEFDEWKTIADLVGCQKLIEAFDRDHSDDQVQAVELPVKRENPRRKRRSGNGAASFDEGVRTKKLRRSRRLLSSQYLAC